MTSVSDSSVSATRKLLQELFASRLYLTYGPVVEEQVVAFVHSVDELAESEGIVVKTGKLK